MSAISRGSAQHGTTWEAGRRERERRRGRPFTLQTGGAPLTRRAGRAPPQAAIVAAYGALRPGAEGPLTPSLQVRLPQPDASGPHAPPPADSARPPPQEREAAGGRGSGHPVIRSSHPQVRQGEASEGLHGGDQGRAGGDPRGGHSSDAPHGTALRAEREPRLIKPTTVLRPIPSYVRKKKRKSRNARLLFVCTELNI